MSLHLPKYTQIFKKLITENPLSFYSIVASQDLQNATDVEAKQLFLSILSKNMIKPTITSSIPIDKLFASTKRLKIWSSLDYKPFIAIERRQILDLTKNENEFEDSPFAYHLLTEIFHESKNYLEAFKTSYKGLSSNDINLSVNILNKMFPRPYEKHIRSSQEGIDPYLILSLMRQESSFNPAAKSHVGALGLMQLMPNTAKQISRSISSKALLTPHANIDIGTKYLKMLLDKYDNNVVYSLAAYNAGESRVDRWRKKYFKYDSLMHNVESIPFDETRKYVKLILRNMFYYKLMQNKDSEQKSQSKNLFGVAIGFKI